MSVKTIYNECYKIVKNSVNNLSKITKKDVQDHLSRHYVFYKSVAVGLIALGSILSLSMLGANWDTISRKVSHFLYDEKNIISKAIFSVLDYSVDGILIPCYEIAQNLFNIYTTSHIFRAISYLTATTFMTAGISAFIALNIPRSAF